MLLCFASSRIPSSTSAAAKLLTGSGLFLKLAQPRGSGAALPSPCPCGPSGEEGQGPGLKHIAPW